MEDDALAVADHAERQAPVDVNLREGATYRTNELLKGVLGVLERAVDELVVTNIPEIDPKIMTPTLSLRRTFVYIQRRKKDSKSDSAELIRLCSCPAASVCYESSFPLQTI